jgi:chromosome segregation ATPase
LPNRGRALDDTAMSDPYAQPRHPTRKWIVATVVLLLVAIGLGVWAFSLRSDVDDKDAQIAAQQQQLEQQQGVAGNVQDAAAGLAADAQQAFDELGKQIDELEGAAAAGQEETQAAIDEAEQAAEDAKARADSAQDEVDEANARADEATANAEAAGACARGYLSAIGSAFDAASVSEGVTQAMTEIETLNTSCAGALRP